jgi:hypothetical protein
MVALGSFKRAVARIRNYPRTAAYGKKEEMTGAQECFIADIALLRVFGYATVKRLAYIAFVG